MPTISQLPAATTVSAADTIPISQGGAAKSISVGTVLESAQPVITIASQSLLGRVSLGSGGPEQIDVGLGLALNSATLSANGLDHANFSQLETLDLTSELVVSLQGSPKLMSTSLLRGLFEAGQNVAISSGGVISSTGNAGGTSNFNLGSTISSLQVAAQLSAGDLLPVDQSGSARAITYSSLLNGLTIDQATTAGPVADTDTFWVGQGTSTMASQSFAAIWSWIIGKLPMYQAPVTEVISNTVLVASIHNARIIVCSQPVTITAPVGGLGNGFCCKLINTSSGGVTLGAGFVTSTGVPTLNTWQSATVFSLTYSGGTITYASLDYGTNTTVQLPDRVVGLTANAIGTTSLTVSWQVPATGATPSGYITKSRLTGSPSWTSWPVVSLTTYEISGLSPGTSYDIFVQAVTESGVGPASGILTVSTANTGTQATIPLQVTGVTATALSSNSVQVSWLAQTGSTAAASYTVEYRVSGSSTWSGTISGVTGTGTIVTGLQPATSYDFAVLGINSAGSGPVSAVVTAATSAVTSAGSVSSISWNLLPSGTYTASSGSIGVNANVTPGSAAIQFGFSQSMTVRPSSWTAAILVNSNLWGAYVPTPASAGSWYAWAEGTDGSTPTVSSTPFSVQ